MSKTARHGIFKKLTPVIIGGLGLFALPALAQQTTYIGGSGSPNVQVDLSVLDSLGTIPNIAESHRLGLAGLAARAGVVQSRTKQMRTRPAPPLPSRRNLSAAQSMATRQMTAAVVRPAVTTMPAPRIANVAPNIPSATAALAPVPAKMRAPAPKATAPATVARAKITPKKSAPKIAAPKIAAPKKQAPIRLASLPKATSTPTRELKAPPAPKAAAPTPPSVKAPSAKPLSAKSQGMLSVSVGFDVGVIKLTDGAQSELERVITTLSKNEDLRVRLHAFAKTPDGNKNAARRLSLSRALAVRSYLMDKGIRSTRMDVRALGNQSDGAAADRVDVTVVKR
jgi:outer membrane protein OmpA-like peptidoglycan-associated protein